MFKIGKLENVKDENIDIKLVTQEQVKYRKGKKVRMRHSKHYLLLLNQKSIHLVFV